MKQLVFILVTILVIFYFYNFNVSNKIEYIEFEYNTTDEDFQTHLQAGWSSIKKTEFGKGILPLSIESNINFHVPQIDTYLFRITFYSKNKVELNQINAFLENLELKKIGSGLKKDKKYIEFILDASNIKKRPNILKLAFDRELVGKLVFITFKFQNFTGYNSHFPEFKVISDTSVYLKQINNIKPVDTILVLICAGLLMFISGYIWFKFSESEFVNSLKNSSYSFVTVVLVYLSIIIASVLTEYHVLFSLSSFIVFTVLITLITELILLYLMIGIARKKFMRLISGFADFIRRNSDILIYALTGLYFAIMSTLTILKHITFHSNACDMALFDQIVLNIIKGKGAYITFLSRNYLNEHLSLIFFLLAPFYYIYNSPVTLLIIQALFLSSGALAIYILAKYVIKDKLVALIFSFVYLISSKLLEANFFDFHQESFIPLFLILAFYSGLKKHYISYFIYTLIAFLIREDMAIYMAVIGLYFLFIEKDKKIGIASIIIGVAWFIIAITFLIKPDASHSQHSVLEIRYSYLGTDVPSILKTVFLNPLIPLKHIIKTSLKPTLIVFLKMIFLPFLNLPTLVLLIFPLSATMLSDYSHQYKLDAEYAIPIITFVSIASIYGFSKISRNKTRNIILALMLLINIFSFFRFIDKGIDKKWFVKNEHEKIASVALSKIPHGVSISAQTSFLPHLSRHEKNYIFPYVNNAEYVIIDKNGNRWPLGEDEYFIELEKLKKDKKYREIYGNDGITVFKRSEL